jgi:uncharacterized protein with PQ loop repeat
MKEWFDLAVYFVGTFGLLMTIPQILKIFMEHNAAGLSLISFSSYFIANLVWIGYGFFHKSKPIYYMSIVAAFFYIAIITGIVIYG